MTYATYLSASPNEIHRDRVCLLDDERFAIRNGAATRVVRWGEVIYLRSAANRTRLFTTDGEVTVRASMTAMVGTLGALGCVRIHRGLAVNGAKVSMLIGRGGHGLTIVLENEVRLEVGRRFQRVVRGRFGVGWVGGLG